MRSYGCKKSTLIGNELKAENSIPMITIPEKYSLRNLMPIRDQGSIPKCVSVALTDVICWKLKSMGIHPNLRDDIFWNNRLDRTTQTMTVKEAFNLLIDYHITQYNYDLYAIVGSIECAKRCIIQNGPLIACLPVKSYYTDFWNGNENIGGHACLLTGFDSTGFELRNSWGTSFGDFGYCKFSYQDFNKGWEYWTLIK